MAARVLRLRSKPNRLRAEQAAALRQALLPFEDDMPDVVREVRGYIARHTASHARWVFLLMSPMQNRIVVRWLRANSARPMQAAILWAELFTALDLDTGEVMLTRDEIAEGSGIPIRHVSDIMSELETCGAISRRRERVAGMRGPGRVRYFMNPMVATHLAGQARDDAQAAAPALRVVDGGKATPGSRTPAK